MATQKKTAAKKGIKVRDLKPSRDAKGGVGRNLDSRSADGSRHLDGSQNLNRPSLSGGTKNSN